MVRALAERAGGNGTVGRGLREPISRRDFLDGILLTGAGLLLPGKAATTSPADAFNGYGGVGDYRHSNGKDRKSVV